MKGMEEEDAIHLIKIKDEFSILLSELTIFLHIPMQIGLVIVRRR